MDIHKPKPWHGVREFLKEFGTIVLGVLVALGAEQAVEWLHWRHQVDLAEESIQPEVTANLLNAYERVVSMGCVQNRIALLKDALLQPGPDWRAAAFVVALPNQNNSINGSFAASPMPLVVQSSNTTWSDGAWSAAVASGVPLHMRPDRVRAYTSLYQRFQGLRDLRTQEKENSATLSVLAFDRPLGAADRSHYLDVLATVNYANRMMGLSASTVVKQAADAGIRIPKSEFEKRLAYWRQVPQLRGCLNVPTLPLGPG